MSSKGSFGITNVLISLLTRHPFANALSFLMLMAELDTQPMKLNEKAASGSFSKQIVYVHVGLFLLCGFGISFRMERHRLALIYFGQILYFVYQTAFKIPSSDWLKMRILPRHIGVAGCYLIYASWTYPPQDSSPGTARTLHRFGSGLIAMTFLTLAYSLYHSSVEQQSFRFFNSSESPYGQLLLTFVLVALYTLSCMAILSEKVPLSSVARLSIPVLLFQCLLSDLSLSYWTGRRMLFWHQIRVLIDSLTIIICLTVTALKGDHIRIVN